MSNVQVAGMVLAGDAHGLTEAHSEWRKEMAEQGDSLLNISGIGTKTGVPVHKDSPRPAYRHQEYPRAMHHPRMVADPEHGTAEAGSKEQEDELIEQGYRREPYARVQVAFEDPKFEKIQLQKQLKERDGQIATLSDQLGRLEKIVDGLSKSKK